MIGRMYKRKECVWHVERSEKEGRCRVFVTK